MDTMPDHAELVAAGSGRFTDVRVLTSVDSTNTELLRLAGEGASEGVVLVADHQTAGHGRHGRTWEAPAGSALLVSALLRPDLPPERVSLLTLAAGVAMADAIQAASGVPVALKWPNDLRVADRKLGGILCEARADDGRVDAVVVGVGVNLRRAALSEEVAEVAVALDEVTGGDPVARAAVLAPFLDRLDHWVTQLTAGPRHLLDDYTPRCETIGRGVRADRIVGDPDPVEGTAVGIGEAGELLIRTGAGATVAVSTGEVHHLR